MGDVVPMLEGETMKREILVRLDVTGSGVKYCLDCDVDPCPFVCRVDGYMRVRPPECRKAEKLTKREEKDAKCGP